MCGPLSFGVVPMSFLYMAAGILSWVLGFMSTTLFLLTYMSSTLISSCALVMAYVRVFTGL